MAESLEPASQSATAAALTNAGVNVCCLEAEAESVAAYLPFTILSVDLSPRSVASAHRVDGRLGADRLQASSSRCRSRSLRLTRQNPQSQNPRARPILFSRLEARPALPRRLQLRAAQRPRHPRSSCKARGGHALLCRRSSRRGRPRSHGPRRDRFRSNSGFVSPRLEATATFSAKLKDEIRGEVSQVSSSEVQTSVLLVAAKLNQRNDSDRSSLRPPHNAIPFG